ncbi:MAG TPA: helix-turn-helix transcriptional regulator [Solirubrobacterales bacterium]|nr:helix-turn-helix transcriptional regulator [Solirubrobacterales bacterium]
MSINPVTERFAENMLIHRRRAGFSQEELGFRANLHRTEISALEVGSREAKIATVIKLAGALSVTPNDLLAGIEWKAPPGLPLLGKLTVRD